MATGWGAMGGGAWNTKPPLTTPDPDLDDEAPSTQPGASPLYAGQQGGYQPPAVYQAQPSSGYNSAFQPSAAPAAVAGGAGGGTSLVRMEDAVAAREAELNKRAAELDAKERRLRELEQDLQASGAVIKRKNWPLWPKLIYHNIAEDIPEKSRRVVREAYYCWWGLVWCLTWNFFCASVILGTGSAQKVPSWFLTIIYAVLGIPLGFWLWYLRIYRAARDDSKLGYMVFFVGFAIHCGFCIWAAIAVPFSSEAWSFAGWVTALTAFGEGVFPGAVYIVGACFWSIESLYSLWVCKDAYLFFRGKGGVEQAKQQAAIEAFQRAQQGHV